MIMCEPSYRGNSRSLIFTGMCNFLYELSKYSAKKSWDILLLNFKLSWSHAFTFLKIVRQKAYLLIFFFVLRNWVINEIQNDTKVFWVFFWPCNKIWPKKNPKCNPWVRAIEVWSSRKILDIFMIHHYKCRVSLYKTTWNSGSLDI